SYFLLISFFSQSFRHLLATRPFPTRRSSDLSHFAANAAGIQGSGWSVLGWDSLGQRLSIFQLYDQQSNVPVSITPLFMLDMWEHAFYLDYLNVKADYIKAVWNIANWQDVSARLAKARSQSTV